MHAADAVTFLETEVQLHVLVQMSIEIYARDISGYFFLDSRNRAMRRALLFERKSINGYLLMSDRSTKEKVRNRE